jgi:hypothetical protein
MPDATAEVATEPFEVCNRWTGNVQFTAHIQPGLNWRLRLGAAVKWAIGNRGADLGGANLGGADLGGANLRGANLRGANLGGADLGGADLGGADLRGADLGGADLRGANLGGANLGGADLGGADLRGADLGGANLGGADLGDADLGGANLGGANLGGANLRDADLGGANLGGANLGGIKADFLSEVLRLPDELEALRDALTAGKIDGSTYSGECACLAGTLAKAHGEEDYDGENLTLGSVVFHTDVYSPREQWFLSIKEGDTPENSQVSAIALEWTNEAIAMRDNIRGVFTDAALAQAEG